MTKKKLFVVLGATGNTGANVASALLSKGQPVRVVVREATKGKSWVKRGAEVGWF